MVRTTSILNSLSSATRTCIGAAAPPAVTAAADVDVDDSADDDAEGGERQRAARRRTAAAAAAAPPARRRRRGRLRVALLEFQIGARLRGLLVLECPDLGLGGARREVQGE